MKKFVSILLTAALTMALCTAGAEGIQDGTYAGEAQGMGKVAVELTMKDGEIADITVDASGETQGLGDKAIEQMKDAMIAQNKIDVDTVAGATISSTALLEAVKDAFSKTGAEASALVAKEAAPAESTMESSYDADVVVVGAGGAGLSAAITAAEAGAKVIVLEKMNNVGGNTMISGGEMAVPGNWLQKAEGIEDSVERFEEDMLKGGDNEADPALVHVIAENALATAEWLRDDVKVEFEDYMLFFGGHSVKRSLVPNGATGVELIEKLTAKAEAAGVEIYTNTPAKQLLTEDGKVVGVKAENNGKEITFNAKGGVILATGGFGSNIEMRVASNPAMDEKILSTNSVGSTGDGITMARELGAQTVDMEYIQTYPTCDPETGKLLYVGDVRLEGRALLVNKEGKRFVEELDRRDVISFATTEQTGGVSYMYFDEASMQAAGVAESHKAEYEDLLARGILVKAESVEEAANFFGIDAVELQKTIDNYNQYCKDGKDLEFNKRGDLIPFEAGPCYIMKSQPAIHHTMGGLKINTDAQVLNTENEVINGLYAAGEVTGDIHGTNRLGSDAIADIMVFGRVAGANAAAAAK